MRGWAILPNGSKQWLLNIRDWNFNWQDQLRYTRPIRLPADTASKWSSSTTTPQRIPATPLAPAESSLGTRTDDEMAGLHVQAIPVHMDELPELGEPSGEPSCAP